MKIKVDGSDIVLIKEPENHWCARDEDYEEFNLDIMNQRDIISYLWKNKPELLRDIICENCPEHTGEN